MPTIFENIEEIAMILAKETIEAVPGATQEEKEAWVSNGIATELNKIEGSVPELAAYLNLELVDDIEKKVIEYIVKRAFEEVNAYGKKQ